MDIITKKNPPANPSNPLNYPNPKNSLTRRFALKP